MSKPLTLRGKFILIAVFFIIFLICLCILNVRIESAILLLFLFPILVVLLGKTGELAIRGLERASTGPLSLTNLRSALLLVGYYFLLSTFLAFLIENSVILSLVNFRPNEWQVAIISLSLAFLPRVLSYASGMERARNILLAVLTPLTLTAVLTLFMQPTALTLTLQTLELCFLGSLILPFVGDLTLFFVGSLGIIHPVITFETVPLLDLQRLVLSQLETIKWDNICQILKKAKLVNRVDIVSEVLLAMNSFLKESRKRGAKYVRIVFIDALTEAVCSEPSLGEDLIPILKAFNVDQEVEIRTRMVASYVLMSKATPEESLRCLAELLDDKEMAVLEAIGSGLTVLLKRNQEAASHIAELSLNPVFLDWLVRLIRSRQFAQTWEHRTADMDTLRDLYVEESVQDFRSVGVPVYFAEEMGGTAVTLRSENPILRALKAAYASSPDTLLDHVQGCCSDKDLRLRVLAATIVSDEEFIKGNQELVEIREKLKNDRSKLVRDALELTRFVRIPRERYLRARAHGMRV
jgi:hypothetical protein